MNDIDSTLQYIKRHLLAMTLAWTLVVGFSLAVNVSNHRRDFYAEMMAQAQGIHAMDLAYLDWLIGKGGVYVQVDKTTQPSKYLKDVPERDILTPSLRKLTLVKSPLMIREVHEEMGQHDGTVRGHISSLNPLNPVNLADPWETEAFKAFTQGEKVVSTIEKMKDGHTYFRYMEPLVTSKACLKCHAQQGYREGDIRGGISVSIPAEGAMAGENRESMALWLGHGLIWLLGIAGLFFSSRQQLSATLAVRKSEAEVRLLSNSIVHAIYGLDMQGLCTFANTSCVKLLGYASEAELLGRDMHSLMHHSRPDGSPYPIDMCPSHQAIHECKSCHLDDEVFWRRDGSSFPAEYWTYPLMKDDQCLGSVVTFLDITEQRRMGEALKHSQSLLDSIVEHVPAMVFLKRAEDLRFELVNDTAEQILGYTRQELLGKNDYDYFPAEQAEFFTSNDRTVLNDHKIVDIPEELVSAGDGREKWLHTRKIGLYDGQGNPTHLLGISMDITARKETELNLQKIQNNLAEAQRIAHIGSWEFDLLTNRIYWSAEIYRIFEISPESFDTSYESFLELVHPEDREAVNKAYENALITRTPYEFEHRISLPDDRCKYVLERCETTYDANGIALRSIGTVQDVTDRKLAEIALAHANRALQALCAVNRELVHATDESALLQSICQVIVEQKGYQMAWVCYVQDDAAKSIKLMASAGEKPECHLAKMQASWAEEAFATGLCGRAVRSGKTQLLKDLVAQNQQIVLGQTEHAGHGCIASITLPLQDKTGAVFGVLNVHTHEDVFTDREIELLEEMARDLAFGVRTNRMRLERDRVIEQNKGHLAQLHANLEETIVAISKAVEARDPYTGGHQRRVAELACAIAKELGLDDDRIVGIRMGATIHDIGKIQVPAEILTKPTRLTQIEFLLIKEHTRVGFEILQDIHFPWPVKNIAYQHHERLDGSGYPQGLKGEEICFEARIVGVADVVEAMSSHRPYRPAQGVEVALEEMRLNRGVYYDAQVVDACLALFAGGYQLPQV